MLLDLLNSFVDGNSNRKCKEKIPQKTAQSNKTLQLTSSKYKLTYCIIQKYFKTKSEIDDDENKNNL